MANPLLLFLMRTSGRRRRPATIPDESPSTDAIFLALRRMRTPLIVLITIFAISVAGLTVIPGKDAAGQPTRLSIFDAFYFISYTATTIGFGEIVPFTPAQRMWVTVSIYLTVIGWAYAIGTSFALLQDESFREALAVQAFQRRVRMLREPFVLVAGYGKAGRQVTRQLDQAGMRVVVVDRQRSRVDRLASDALFADVPGLEADAGLPSSLGTAGLGSRHCTAVLALTDDDATNLAVVMTASLLRPDVGVVARCQDRTVASRMTDLGPTAVVNPDDRYGAYLVMALQRPATYTLVTWLMAGEGAPLPQLPEGFARGRWVVASDGRFGEEVAADLRAGGMTVDLVDPQHGPVDVAGASGFVAGTGDDATNLALADRARREEPRIFVSVRQGSDARLCLVEALGIDSVYTPTDLVAVEALGRVVTPVFWGFVEHAVRQEDAWAADLLAVVRERCGTEGPRRLIVTLDRVAAPAVERWLRHSPLSLGDLLRDPEEREERLPVVALMLLRGDEVVHAPGEETGLRAGDRLLLVGTPTGLAMLHQCLDYDSVVEYAATGRLVPDGWVWRRLTGVRGRGELGEHRSAQRHPGRSV